MSRNNQINFVILSQTRYFVQFGLISPSKDSNLVLQNPVLRARDLQHSSSRIPGLEINLLDIGGLVEFPCKGMAYSIFSKDEDVNFFASLLFVTGLALRCRLIHNHLGHNVGMKMGASCHGIIENIKEE